MNELRAFRRDDGRVGIRNHLFALPAVVCANQVAIDVARRYPVLKYIEHQHGCAQIGADLAQTQRIFTDLALHDNVFSSMFVGLGCEGIIASNLFAKAKNRTQKPLDLVIIQESGGTLQTEALLEQWLALRCAEVDFQNRLTVDWSNILVGFLMDDVFNTSHQSIVSKLIQTLYDVGARLVVPARAAHLLEKLVPITTQTDYGQSSQNHYFAMKEGTNILETATGLSAAGAHLIIHLATTPHAFGNPLSPIIRFAYGEEIYRSFRSDFDGVLTDDADIPQLFHQLTRTINGQQTVAEEMGMDDFALYRIGPTV